MHNYVKPFDALRVEQWVASHVLKGGKYFDFASALKKVVLL